MVKQRNDLLAFCHPRQVFIINAQIKAQPLDIPQFKMLFHLLPQFLPLLLGLLRHQPASLPLL